MRDGNKRVVKAQAGKGIFLAKECGSREDGMSNCGDLGWGHAPKRSTARHKLKTSSMLKQKKRKENKQTNRNRTRTIPCGFNEERHLPPSWSLILRSLLL